MLVKLFFQACTKNSSYTTLTEGEIAQMVEWLLHIPAIPGSNPVFSMLQRAFEK